MAIEYFRPRYGGPKQRAKRAGEYRGRTAFVVGGRRTTGQNRPKTETGRSEATGERGTAVRNTSVKSNAVYRDL